MENLITNKKPILVTMDVESLYPSIPQDELLKTVYIEMCTHTALISFPPNLIIALLHLCVNNCYFQFGDLTFQQHKGTTIGAPFSPSVANIFMSVFFRKFLISQETAKPLLLKRYIDDIFIVWLESEEKLLSFLNAANSFHDNIKFTYEFSKERANFLDVTFMTYQTEQGWQFCCKLIKSPSTFTSTSTYGRMPRNISSKASLSVNVSDTPERVPILLAFITWLLSSSSAL